MLIQVDILNDTNSDQKLRSIINIKTIPTNNKIYENSKKISALKESVENVGNLNLGNCYQFIYHWTKIRWGKVK